MRTDVGSRFYLVPPTERSMKPGWIGDFFSYLCMVRYKRKDSGEKNDGGRGIWISGRSVRDRRPRALLLSPANNELCVNLCLGTSPLDAFCLIYILGGFARRPAGQSDYQWGIGWKRCLPDTYMVHGEQSKYRVNT